MAEFWIMQQLPQGLHVGGHILGCPFQHTLHGRFIFQELIHSGRIM